MRSGSRPTSGTSAWPPRSSTTFAYPAILHDLRLPRVRLLTNNPRKVRALSEGGIEIVERLPCEVGPTAHSLAYLQTKKQKMGHALSLKTPGPGRGPQGIEVQL